mmetsp:Transcript_27661/g.36930  ORF Transcript_27661/g.36930 Transcript_27661/m.36930 type:complete len:111 (+) Transcript_27661:1387-1719(+)|eukprot:CAMPEP_0185571792 /NCGR_PEP_ID=MMETSP0434-20130131/3802_1 /TAXON_ID=626734 ORGANISM="Favella taraikaensis, Strain Fe Narragansett Bay" /NCGR_SAMPLE_ID=MMETSP0434 /ASSEMBLY_ACC=CAM_ASM_000379 /LENGTH=110 /DNA_ID=CAMNT_0028187381 /DNA_START=1312 /DNA_END=1644 /DNA_ORIENTATION=+
MSISHILRQLRVLRANAKESKSVAEWESLKARFEVVAYSDLDSQVEKGMNEIRAVTQATKASKVSKVKKPKKATKTPEKAEAKRGGPIKPHSDSHTKLDIASPKLRNRPY